MKFNQKQNVIAENTAKTAAETAAETVVNNVAETVANCDLTPEQKAIIIEMNKEAANTNAQLVSLVKSIKNCNVVKAMEKKNLVFKSVINPSEDGKLYVNIRVYDVAKDKELSKENHAVCINFAEVQDGEVKMKFFGEKAFFFALDAVECAVSRYIVMKRLDYFKIPKKAENKESLFEFVDYNN